MSNQLDNWPCTCGHTKYDHYRDNDKRADMAKGLCVALDDTKLVGQLPYCYHEHYEPDNLKYLENLL